MNGPVSALVQEALSVGAEISENQAEILLKYADLLLEANKKFNLTAITDPTENRIKHLIDSLSLIPVSELRGSVADVGSGPGFPGVVIAAARADCNVTLIEATAKKLAFCLQAAGSLRIPVSGIHGRAEELARGKLRESFDTVTARAVAAMPALCEYCLPLVRVGGAMIAMKGPAIEDEIRNAESAMQALGGELVCIRRLTLPDGSERSIAVIGKRCPTPELYPRGGKKIREASL